MNATSPRLATLIWGVLCGAAAATGLWALLAPGSFFSSFPGLGLRWVTGDGPYNEHLTRDVGAFNLALVAFTVGVLRVAPQAAAWAAVAWEVYALPHLAYHLSHLEHVPGMLDRVTSAAGLVVFAVLPVAALVASRRGRGAPGGPVSTRDPAARAAA